MSLYNHLKDSIQIVIVCRCFVVVFTCGRNLLPLSIYYNCDVAAADTLVSLHMEFLGLSGSEWHLDPHTHTHTHTHTVSSPPSATQAHTQTHTHTHMHTQSSGATRGDSTGDQSHTHTHTYTHIHTHTQHAHTLSL
eukprot:GHVR01023377.1.p1 GENE.GHVR01023377.1~~GHVR01023377.1.p1  ORF type:complete len:136 (-),score=75.68 GHVR01023377.1:33-440(-)